MAENPFREVFLRKNSDLRDLEVFVSVCVNALDKATNAVRQVELIRETAAELGDPSPFPTDDDLEKAKTNAALVEKFANLEKSRGFPYLFGLAIVRLWGVLEALVDEIVARAFRDPSRCRDQDVLTKLKGPLLDFRNASPDEQAEFLTEILKVTLDASLKPGIGKFEAVLAPIGLGGGVDDLVRRNLYELSQLRNAIVHRAAKADRRLLEACPWLQVKSGDSLLISDKDFRRYRCAAYWYLLELNSRCREFIGEARRETTRHIQEDLIREMAEFAP